MFKRLFFSTFLSLTLVIISTASTNAALSTSKYVTAEVGVVLSNGEMNVDFRNCDQSKEIYLCKDNQYTLEVTNYSSIEDNGFISYAVYNRQDECQPIVAGVVSPNKSYRRSICVENDGNYYVVLTGRTSHSFLPTNGFAKLGLLDN